MDTLSPRAAALVALVAGLVFGLLPALLGPEAIVARIPDDAFYYFVLAKNFVAQGTWTFDGAHAATGFHLLFGYLLAGLYAVAPGIGFVPLYVLVCLMNAVMMAGAVHLLATVCREEFGDRGGLGILLVALSAGGLHLVAFPMESGLVVFLAALGVSIASRAMRGHEGLGVERLGVERLGAAALATGVAGVLARSDYVVLPFALAGGLVLHLAWHRRRPARSHAALAWLCLGALVGLGLVTLHTYAFTGGLVQRSASVKHFWASVSGYTALPGIARVVELFQPYALPRTLVPIALAAALAWIAWRRRLGPLLDNPLVLGALAAIAGYAAVCTLNGAVQYWYAATFFAAVAVLAAALVTELPIRGRVVPLALVALYAASAGLRFANPPWPWQVATMQAGTLLRDDPTVGPVGAWNAGIVAYFAGRPVVNLDGLVNDDVYPAIVSGRLAAYLGANKIAYLVDFPSMLSPAGGARGGYADGTLVRCARPERTIAPAATFDGTPLTLFKVDLACTEAAPRPRTAGASVP